MAERNQFRVSCKAALFTEDLSEVLLAEYDSGHYGLPGGHIEEADDSPETAVARELQEEFGLEGVDLEIKHSWFHDNGKLVIGYMGVISKDTQIKVQVEELEAATWTPVHEIESGQVIVRSYAKFILKCVGINADVSQQSSSPALQIDHQ